jgi:hypothetical protein
MSVEYFNMSKKDLFKRTREKAAQRRGRLEAELAGTNGRREHKGKAATSHKATGGKMAR